LSTDVGVGDAEVAVLTVEPADAGTAVTLTVTGPDGTSIAVTMTGAALVPIPDTSPIQYSQVWTADTPVVYDQAGRWVLHYEVTGTGEGAEDLEVFVTPSPVAGGPTWAPGRSRVANYIPHRTLVRSATSTIASEDGYEYTFTSETRPTGVQVDRLIADGIAWVSALITPMHPTSEAAAGLLAALYSAIAVERSWPDDDQALQRANDMEKRLDNLLASLTAANRTANDGDLVTPPGAPAVNPYWSFPPADPRYDSAGYW
jgi:hypothetical protein